MKNFIMVEAMITHDECSARDFAHYGRIKKQAVKMHLPRCRDCLKIIPKSKILISIRMVGDKRNLTHFFDV